MLGFSGELSFAAVELHVRLLGTLRTYDCSAGDKRIDFWSHIVRIGLVFLCRMDGLGFGVAVCDARMRFSVVSLLGKVGLGNCILRPTWVKSYEIDGTGVYGAGKIL